MLQPVSATSPSIDIASPSAQAVMPARSSVAAVAPPDASAMPVSGGRLGAMSLSAQLQLAQGVSVFAETIGALLKLPRGQNEALGDYAQRIVAAVQSLSPAEKASLEKALNQLVRGVTLQLLADILKGPAGPDTARLAAALELSQLQGKDPPATSAVGSYLQNLPGEAAPSPTKDSPGAPVPPAAAAAGSPASGSAATPAMGQPLPAVAAGSSGQTAPATTEPADATDSPPVAAGNTAAVPAVTKSLPSASLLAPQEDSLPGPPPASAGTTARGSAGAKDAPESAAASAPTTPPAATQTAPPTGSEIAPLPYDLESSLAPIEAEATAVAETLKQLPQALASGEADTEARVQGLGGAGAVATDGDGASRGAAPPGDAAGDVKGMLTQDMLRAARALGQNAVLAMAQWLSDALPADPTPKGAALPPPTSADGPDAPLADTSPPKAPPGTAPANHPAEPSKSAAGVGTSATEALGTDIDQLHTATIAPSRPSSTSTSPSPSPPAGQEAAAMALPIPVPKEGVPLPFVPYPPARDEHRERGGRRTKEVTKVDEEGEEPPPGGQQAYQGRDGGKGRPREDAGPEAGTSGETAADGGSDGSGGDRSAHDLYWRMAGWS